MWFRGVASGGARVVGYIVVGGIALAWAFYAGIAHYNAGHCGAPDAYDCDLGDFEGAAWALITFGILVVMILSVEVGLRLRRRSRT